MGAEERQCAGVWGQIAGKLLEEEAFGPLPQLGGNSQLKPIAGAEDSAFRQRARELRQ